jgi:uncharacterized protein (TIGR03067 family)
VVLATLLVVSFTVIGCGKDKSPSGTSLSSQMAAAGKEPTSQATQDSGDSELDGQWALEQCENSIGTSSTGGGHEVTLTIKGNVASDRGFRITLVRPGEKQGIEDLGETGQGREGPPSGTIKADATKKPRTIELKWDNKTFKGIYAVNRELLVILMSQAGGDYPTVEVSINDPMFPKGFKGTLYVYSRFVPKKK